MRRTSNLAGVLKNLCCRRRLACCRHGCVIEHASIFNTFRELALNRLDEVRKGHLLQTLFFSARASLPGGTRSVARC